MGNGISGSRIGKIGLLLTAAALTAGCASTFGAKKEAKKNDTQLLNEQVALLRSELGSLQERLNQVDRGQAELQSELAALSERADQRRRTNITTVPKQLSIRQVQTALKKAGYYNDKVDGRNGPATKNGLKKFQKDQGLKADGIIGPNTRQALAAYLE